MTPAPLISVPLTPVLLTSRLLLRPFEHEDATALARLLNDPAVAVGVCSVPQPFTKLHAAARILMIRAKEMAGLDFAWAIEDVEGALVGTLGLAMAGTGIANLGYSLSQHIWGHGYATEAVSAVLEWSARNLPLQEIRAEVFVDNPASARVLAKLSFEEIGFSSRFSLARLDTDPTRVFRLREIA